MSFIWAKRCVTVHIVFTSTIFFCTLYGDFFEHFLQHCRQLKNLSIYRVRFALDIAERRLFRWTHPTLQRIEYIAKEENWDQICILLDRNPNIKHVDLRIDTYDQLLKLLAASNIQLHSLNINLINWQQSEFVGFVKLLQTLYDRGTYKSLKLIGLTIPMQNLEISPLNGLEGLFVGRFFTVLPLTHLKELGFMLNRIDIQAFAKHSTKLERFDRLNRSRRKCALWSLI